MWGIVCVLISSCLFIHLGMGETIEKTIRIRFVLFRCVKCLTFWSVLGYSLLVEQFSVVVSICVSFVCAYAALWIDLLLVKLSSVYEKLSENVVAEESESVSATNRDQEDKGGEGEESALRQL